MIEEKMKSLGIEIPKAPKPLAAYIPVTIDDKIIYTAGQLPLKDGKLMFEGHTGKEVTPEEAKQAAKQCAINCLSVLKSAAGSLDNIERIIKVTVFVSSAEGFTGQPQVANGASELLGEVFGEAGKHVRSAVGVNELPINAPVEIEMVAKLK